METVDFTETPTLSDLKRSFLQVYLNARRDKIFG